MTHYKVEVRNSSSWRNHSAATLGVSISSPNWHDDKFASILQFAVANFTTLRIDITDALYRHNFAAEGMAPAEALARANSLGSLWLARHADMIDAAGIKPVIIRWAEWYEHPDYATVTRAFINAHDKNIDLQAAIHQDIVGFYERKKTYPSSLEYEHGRDYLLEELAVITLQARSLPGVRLYPGEQLNCLRIVAQGRVPEAPKGLELEEFAKIKFDKRLRQPPHEKQQGFMLRAGAA